MSNGGSRYKWQVLRGLRDFPGISVVKTSASNGGGAVSNPGQGVKISHALWQKKQNKKT